MLKGLHLPSSKISKTMSPDVQLLVPQCSDTLPPCLSICTSIYLNAVAPAERFHPSRVHTTNSSQTEVNCVAFCSKLLNL